VAEWARQHRSSGRRGMEVGMEVRTVQWEVLEGGFVAQLDVMGWVDIFISSAGGGSTNAVFARDGAAMLTSQLCHLESGAQYCDFFDGPALYYHFPSLGIFVYTSVQEELSPSAGAAGYFDVTFERGRFTLCQTPLSCPHPICTL
jgi:hypothetical protein